MDEMLDGIISEEISLLACEGESQECEMTDTKVNYGEENSNCFEENECLCDPNGNLEGEGESDGKEDMQRDEGKDKELGDENKNVSREEDTRLYSSTEDISGDEAVRVLKRELDDLRRQLGERDRAYERLMRECAEFIQLYPDTPIRSLPDTVWEGVKDGVPIAAGYALYEKKRDAEARRAAEHNEKNGTASAGSCGGGTNDFYFSPDEVRRMSPFEVKQNYTKILESMCRWN